MIVVLKFLHLGGLSLWCAALIALPVFLQTHGRTTDQSDYDRFRLVTHIGYIAIATPAALLTIAAGTGLVFAAGVFTPWLVVKLGLVAGMVLVHVWIGHLVQIAGEKRKSRFAIPPVAGLWAAGPLILGVLGIVLWKPDLGFVLDWLPDHLLVARGAAPS